jgi:hypothetical protein
MAAPGMHERIKRIMKKTLIFGFLAVLIAAAGIALYAQKAALATGEIQFLDTSGAICIGCKIATCGAGLTCGVGVANPLATTSDAAGMSTNANPVVLDSAGRGSIWTTPGSSYKIEAYTAGNVLMWTQDNVPGGSLVGAATVLANKIFAGPASGGAATPTFRLAVAADLPALTLAGIPGGSMFDGVVIANDTSATAAVPFPSDATQFLNGNKLFSVPAMNNITAGLIKTGTTLTLVDAIDVQSGPCDNATAVIGVSHPTANPSVSTCYTGSNTQFAAELFTATTQTFQFHVTLPPDWVSSTGNDAIVYFKDITDTNVGHNEAFNVSTACTANAATLDPAFNTAQVLTAAVSAGAAATMNTATQTTFTSTGCAAGRSLWVKVGLDASRTATGNAAVLTVRLKVKRTVTTL